MSGEQQNHGEQQQQPSQAELLDQVEERQKLLETLADEFDPANTARLGHSPEEIDQFIADGISAGGFFTPKGVEGPADPNFPGAEIAGANPDWSDVLSNLRAAKFEAYKSEQAQIESRFDLLEPLGVPKGAGPSPEALAKPIEFADSQVQELVEIGVFKVETGADAEPDGLFSGNRIMATTLDAQPLLDRMREQTVDLLRRRVDSDIASRISGSPNVAADLGRQARELMSRGLIDVVITQHREPQRDKNNRQRVRDEVAIHRFRDESSQIVTGVYTEAFRDALSKLSPSEQHKFNQEIIAAKAELSTLRQRGARYLEDHRRGTGDPEGALAARQRIDQLNAIETKITDQEMLFDPANTKNGYAENIRVAVANDAFDRAYQRSEVIANGGSLDRDEAHEMALADDREAAAQSEVWEDYTNRLDISAREQAIRNTEDRALRKALERKLELDKEAMKAERQEAVNAEAKKQREITEEFSADYGKILDSAMLHEPKHSSYNLADGDKLSALAALTRASYKLDPVPFRVNPLGGQQRRFGRDIPPEVMESFFSTPLAPNIVVVERHEYATGKLLSTNVIALETDMDDAVRDGSEMPTEFWQLLEDIRRDESKIDARNSEADQNLPEFDEKSRRSGEAIFGPSGIYAAYGASMGDIGNVSGRPRPSFLQRFLGFFGSR